MIIFPDFTEDEMDLQTGADAYQAGDYEKAVEFYTKAAAAGNVTALSNLGYCHYYGRGVPIDKNAAQNCWERAGILGDIAAIYKLGDMYRNGDLKEDLTYSHALYRRAFQMALKSEDIYVYPDAFLRMLKYYPDEACTDDRDTLDIGRACVEGIEQRIAEGDHCSERVLREAKRILSELERKESE